MAGSPAASPAALTMSAARDGSREAVQRAGMKARSRRTDRSKLSGSTLRRRECPQSPRSRRGDDPRQVEDGYAALARQVGRGIHAAPCRRTAPTASPGAADSARCPRRIRRGKARRVLVGALPCGRRSVRTPPEVLASTSLSTRRSSQGGQRTASVGRRQLPVKVKKGLPARRRGVPSIKCAEKDGEWRVGQ